MNSTGFLLLDEMPLSVGFGYVNMNFFFYDFESHFKELWNGYLMCRIGSILFANGIGFSFWTWNMNFFLFIWFCVYFDELDILYDELNLVLTKWDRSWIMVHGLFWWFIEPNFLCFGTHSTPTWPLLTCNSYRTRIILFDFSSSYVKIWF